MTNECYVKDNKGYRHDKCEECLTSKYQVLNVNKWIASIKWILYSLIILAHQGDECKSKIHRWEHARNDSATCFVERRKASVRHGSFAD